MTCFDVVCAFILSETEHLPSPGGQQQPAMALFRPLNRHIGCGESVISAHVCSSAFHAGAVTISSVSPIDKVESRCFLKDAVSNWLVMECMFVGYSGGTFLNMQCSAVGSTPFRAFTCTGLHFYKLVKIAARAVDISFIESYGVELLVVTLNEQGTHPCSCQML